MTAPAPQDGVEDIDALMERASVALEAMRYFEVERLGSRALGMAHRARDYDRMARILLPLQESRRLRRQQAMDADRRTPTASPVPADSIKPGCYLLQPPADAAAARALRDAADARHVPVVALAVVPGPGGRCTVAMHGDAPVSAQVASPRALTTEWIESALEQLGDAALARLDRGGAPAKLVDQLIAMLDAHRDHEKLHQRLADVCRRALHEATPAGPRRG